MTDSAKENARVSQDRLYNTYEGLRFDCSDCGCGVAVRPGEIECLICGEEYEVEIAIRERDNG